MTAPAVEVYPAMSIVATWIMLPLGGLAVVSGLALAWTPECDVPPRLGAGQAPDHPDPRASPRAVVAPGLADEAARARAGATAGQPAYAVGPAVSATLLVVNVALRRTDGTPATVITLSAAQTTMLDDPV
jgi:hypothetical protein